MTMKYQYKGISFHESSYVNINNYDIDAKCHALIFS